jgi:hypothetical protein
MRNLVQNPGSFSRPAGVSFNTIANPVGNDRNSIFLVTFMLIFYWRGYVYLRFVG